MLWQRKSPAKSQRRVVQKDQLRYGRSTYNWVVCLKIPRRENLFKGKQENWDRSTPSNSPNAHGTKEKLGKERVRPEGSFRIVSLMSVVLARRNLRRLHGRSPRNKRGAPAKLRGTWRNTWKSSKMRTQPRYTLLLKLGQRRRPLQNYQMRENSWLIPELQCTCWAQKDLSTEEMDTLRRSRNPTVVAGANKRGSTCVRSRSWSHRDGALTRGHACRSIARKALRRTRIFMWVGQRSKHHGWPKRGRTWYTERIVSCLLSFQVYHPALVQVRHQQRLDRTRHQQVQKQNEVTNMHQETGAQKIKKQNKKKNGSRDADDRLRDLLELIVEGVHR